MSTRVIFALSLAALAVAAAVGCRATPAPADAGSTASGAGAATGPYEPVSTLQDIMDAVVDPAADHVWKATGETVDRTGVVDHFPKTDAEWHEFRRQAVMLVEAGNLLSIPGRKVANRPLTLDGRDKLDVDGIGRRLDTDRAVLLGFAASMREVAKQIVDAADRRDKAAVLDLGATLNSVCEACHLAIWYPEFQEPPVK